MPNKKTLRQNQCLSEYEEQKLLVKYLELKGYKFSALPLDTFTKLWSVKMKNKAIGVRAGVPDLMIIVKSKLIFIELKRTKGGVVSEFQKDWLEKLNKCVGISAYVCRGYEEAKNIIENTTLPKC